jgi:type I restriction enzyme S subunit
MNKNWPMVKLSDVLIEQKQRIGRFDADDLPLLGVSNQEGLHRSGMPRITDMSRYLRVERDWFAYNPMRINVGSIGWAQSEEQTGVISPDYVVFSCSDQILPRLVFSFLKHRRGLQEINNATAGSVRERLYFERLAQIEFPLPPIFEQRRVVARIEELAAQIQEARTLRQQAAEEGEALLTTARRTLIAEYRERTVPLEDACAAIIDNLHSNPRLSEAGIPCIRSPDVGYGTLNLDGAQRTDEAEFQRRTVRGEPKADDIVLVREGGGTGKCALVQPGQRFSLGQRVMMLRPNSERILPRFFLHQLLSPQIQEAQIAPLSKGSASPHLNIGALRRFNLILPSLAEQRRIVTELDALQLQLDALKRLQTETGAELDALLPAILDRAFKGGL